MRLIILLFSIFLSVSSYSQGGSGGGGSPGIELNRLQELGLDSNIVHQYEDLMKAHELERLGAEFKKNNSFRENYIPVGEVVDFKVKGREEELDLQAVIDENHEWLKAFNGEYWIRKDAPVENYQNTSGEIIELD